MNTTKLTISPEATPVLKRLIQNEIEKLKFNRQTNKQINIEYKKRLTQRINLLKTIKL